MKLIAFENYRVDYSELFEQFRIHSTLSDNFYYWITPLSCVNTFDESDVTVSFPQIEILEQTAESCRLRAVCRSNLWAKKESYYTITPEGIEHYIKIEGSGKIGRVCFCMGLLDDRVIGSVPGFDSFVPGCPNFLGKKQFFPTDFFSINVTNETSHWGLALNSGPLIYLFEKENIQQCLYAGIITPAGRNVFDCFDYNYKTAEVMGTLDHVVNTQSFSLDYAGHLVVDGEWESPHLYFGFGQNKEECLKRYCNLLEERGAIRKAKDDAPAAWWNKPIFCGWHEQQAALVTKEKKKGRLSREELETGHSIMEKCTQKYYEKWLNIILKYNLPIGTIMIDAKWQKTFAGFDVDISKWPDMRGFITLCHSKGIKVILWIQAWSFEGLALEECIVKKGSAISMDPTSPSYQRRLREGMAYMLSSDTDCLDADGLKVDGTNTMPTGADIKTYDGTYGFELQHKYLKLIYEYAKMTKKDSMISLYTANPYFRDVCDIIRMGDLYSAYGRPIDTLRERAQITKISMPTKPIDTDGALRFSMAEDILKELEEQAKIGIPTLYQIEHFFQCRVFNKPVIRKMQRTDYDRIRSILLGYLKSLA